MKRDKSVTTDLRYTYLPRGNPITEGLVFLMVYSPGGNRAFSRALTLSANCILDMVSAAVMKES